MLRGRSFVQACFACIAFFAAAFSADRTSLFLSTGEVGRGVAASVGPVSAEFLTGVLSQSDLLLHALVPENTVAALRRELADQLGERVVLEAHRGRKLPHADNLLDVVFLPEALNVLDTVAASEVLRVLRPRGKAVAFLGRGSDRARQRWAKWLQASQAGDAGELRVTDAGLLGILSKGVPPGIDAWSHWEHGPDNNPLSSDRVIRAPYRTQWIGGPLYSAMPVVTTAAGGRIFTAMGHIAHHVREEPYLNTLIARNGFNGTILWTRKLPDGYLVHRSAFIATEDTFFLLDRDGCLLVDPETGRQKGRIAVAEIPHEWKYISLYRGVLYFLAGKQKDPSETTVVRSPYSHWSWGELSPGYYKRRIPWGKGRILGAWSLKEGKLLWLHREESPIDSRAVVLGGGKLYFYCPGVCTGCLNAQQGTVLWRNFNKNVVRLIEEPGRGLISTPGFKTTCYCIYTPSAIVYEAQTRMNVVAISPHTGRLLWTRKKTSNNPNMLYAGGRLYVGVGQGGRTLGLDPKTGEVLEDLNFAKRSCARLTGTPDSFFCRGWPEGLTRFDRKTRKVFFNGALRPGCNDGTIGANGLLYIGPWLCDCNLSLMGTSALCSAGDFLPTAEDPLTERYQFAGRAHLAGPEPAAGQWWTYRANLERSASVPVALKESIGRLWTWSPEKPCVLTAPVACGGVLYFGDSRGRIFALDSSTGRMKLSFWTAGPVLRPPAVWRGTVFCGSGDGWLYALSAAGGTLRWRFRIAPQARRILFHGKVCSNWPVASGVAVKDGIVYAAGGIIDYDGTSVCALRAEDGKPVWRNVRCGHLDPVLRKGVSVQGILTIAQGRLWLPGGNVISPAAFDLQGGRCVTRSVGNGSPRSNRGEEIGVLKDRYLIFGGRLCYSSLRNVVDSASFVLVELSEGTVRKAETLCFGRVPPAWDDERIVLVNGRKTPPVCLAVSAIERFMKQERPSRRGRRRAIATLPPLWRASELEGSDTVSIALASKCVCVVAETGGRRRRFSTWQLWILDKQSGRALRKVPLPSRALPGGLAVTGEGRVVVVLENGTVVCFG